MTPEQEQRLANVEAMLRMLVKSDRYSVQKLLQMSDGRNIQLGRKTGTIIGTAADQKLGFFGTTPVIQQPTIGAPSGGGTTDAAARSAIVSLITTLQTLGFIA